MSISIRVQDLSVIKGGRQILKVDSLKINPGEVWGVIGPNGAGKSTLLQALALLEKPVTGELFYDGQKVDFKRALPWRRQLAVVFQEPLLLDTSVFNNVATGLRFRGLPRSVIEARVEYWLKTLQISHLVRRQAWRLSGGEAQRVSLARALALEPKVLFLDEPFAALDAPTRRALLEELHGILSNKKITTIFVTHDFTELPFLADQVAALQEGLIVQTGSPEAILWRPASVELASFVGIANLLPGVASLDGTAPAKVRLQGEITVRAGTRVSGKVVACLRPEEIIIQDLDQERNRAGNCLQGRIEQVTPQGGQYRVEVDCGINLTALAGASQLRQGMLRPGCRVQVSFPAEAIHLIPV